MVRIWSQPTPVRRSASALHSPGAGAGAPSRRSSTTKSLPAPCILLKRSGCVGMAGGNGCGAVAATGSAVAGVRGRRRVGLLRVLGRFIDGVVGGGRLLRFLLVEILRVLDLFDILRVDGPHQRTLVAAGGQVEGKQQ